MGLLQRTCGLSPVPMCLRCSVPLCRAVSRDVAWAVRRGILYIVLRRAPDLLLLTETAVLSHVYFGGVNLVLYLLLPSSYARDHANVSLRGISVSENSVARGSVIFVVNSVLETYQVRTKPTITGGHSQQDLS